MRHVLRRAQGLVPKLVPGLLVGLLLALGPAPSAWAVYKVVGPDGSVTFTDVPPTTAPGSQAAAVPGLAAAPQAPGSALSPHLRQLQQQAPVLVYTTPGCQACEDGLQFLRQRGIPYTEKSIGSPQDAQAFKAMDPDLRVPLLRVAGVALAPGFDSAAWTQALNAAGYPKQSELPPGYRFAPAQPLVPPAAGARPAPGSSGVAAQPPVQPPPNPKAPPGFQF